MTTEGKPGDQGVPGRYCPPAICWCKGCDWYVPRRASERRASTKANASTARQGSSWQDREGATWIDKL